MALPDPIHRRFAHVMRLCHRSTAPMRRAGGFGLESCLDNGCHLVDRIGRLPSTSGSHLPQAVGTLLQEASSPERCGLKIDLEVLGDLLVLTPLGGGQNDATTLRHLLRSSVSAHPTFEFKPIRRLKANGCGGAWHGARISRQNNNSSHL